MYAVYFVERGEERLCNHWDEVRAYQGKNVLIKKVNSREEAKAWFSRQSHVHTNLRGQDDVVQMFGTKQAAALFRDRTRGVKRSRPTRTPTPCSVAEADQNSAADSDDTARHYDLIASTDGACQSRGFDRRRRAAWSVVWHHDQDTCSRCGIRTMASVLDADEEQTNQRAELRAFSEAVRQIANSPCSDSGTVRALIRTDSKWVIQGFTEWMPRLWKRNGFTTVSGSAVKHADVWKAVDAMHAAHMSRGNPPIKVVHVLGHSGDYFNDQADRLATGALETERQCHRNEQSSTSTDRTNA